MHQAAKRVGVSPPFCCLSQSRSAAALLFVRFASCFWDTWLLASDSFVGSYRRKQQRMTNQYFIDGIKKLLKSFVREKRKIYLCIKLPPLGGKY